MGFSSKRNLKNIKFEIRRRTITNKCTVSKVVKNGIFLSGEVTAMSVVPSNKTFCRSVTNWNVLKQCVGLKQRLKET